MASNSYGRVCGRTVRRASVVSQEHTAEEAGLFLLLLRGDLHPVVAALRTVAFLQKKKQEMINERLSTTLRTFFSSFRHHMEQRTGWKSYQFCVHFCLDVSGKCQECLNIKRTLSFQPTRAQHIQQHHNVIEHKGCYIYCIYLLTFSTLILAFALVSMNLMPYSRASCIK